MKCSISLSLIIFVLSTSAFAGTLSDFEYDVTKHPVRTDEGSDNSNNGRSTHDHGKDTHNNNGKDTPPGVAKKHTGNSGNNDVDIIGDVINGVLAVIFSSDSASETMVETPGYQRSDPDPVPRTNDALLSFVRVDVSYQDVQSDVTAVDVRGEVGYDSLGLQIRNTRYWEEEPGDRLDITQFQALLRVPIGSKAEVDFGIGPVFLSGKETSSGTTLTMPILIHPSDHFGFEFRPAWSSVGVNTIQDYDASMMIGWKYAFVRAGYRWVMTDDESLNGPQIGASLRW